MHREKERERESAKRALRSQFLWSAGPVSAAVCVEDIGWIAEVRAVSYKMPRCHLTWPILCLWLVGLLAAKRTLPSFCRSSPSRLELLWNWS